MIRTRVEEGTVAVILNTKLPGNNETVYTPGQEYFDGEAVIVKILSFEEAFKALMGTYPCQIKRLLEQAKVVRSSLRA